MRREDDYQVRRAHLADLTDEQLYDKFWSLIGEIVDPLLELGYKNTSPAIERSVLLRMGFSSLEAKPMVEQAIAHNLISHGVGNVVYRLSKATGMSIRDAGVALSRGELWDQAEKLF